MAGRLRVVLLALTGFGNSVLEALLNDPRVSVSAVFTFRYENPFPYYNERQLTDFCEDRGIVCHGDLTVSSHEGLERLRRYAPDLILVATFKQILKKDVLELPPLGVVNLHPSLLPRFRGPCPTSAALMNGDAVTGVTAHYLNAVPDAGDILLQRPAPILERDNDGTLRHRLARLAGELTPELIDLFADRRRPIGHPQDSGLATSAPRPSADDANLGTTRDLETIRRKIRALNPLPGTYVPIGDRRIGVDSFEEVTDDRPAGLYETGGGVVITDGRRALRVFKG